MKINVNANSFLTALSDQKKLANEVMKSAYKKFVSITPIRSGNARNSTNLSGKTIDAHYAYASRLDEGYSKQAPKGMVEPTILFINQEVNRLTKGK